MLKKKMAAAAAAMMMTASAGSMLLTASAFEEETFNNDVPMNCYFCCNVCDLPGFPVPKSASANAANTLWDADDVESDWYGFDLHLFTEDGEIFLDHGGYMFMLDYYEYAPSELTLQAVLSGGVTLTYSFYGANGVLEEYNSADAFTSSDFYSNRLFYSNISESDSDVLCFYEDNREITQVPVSSIKGDFYAMEGIDATAHSYYCKVQHADGTFDWYQFKGAADCGSDWEPCGTRPILNGQTTLRFSKEFFPDESVGCTVYKGRQEIFSVSKERFMDYEDDDNAANSIVINADEADQYKVVFDYEPDTDDEDEEDPSIGKSVYGFNGSQPVALETKVDRSSYPSYVPLQDIGDSRELILSGISEDGSTTYEDMAVTAQSFDYLPYVTVRFPSDGTYTLTDAETGETVFENLQIDNDGSEKTKGENYNALVYNRANQMWTKGNTNVTKLRQSSEANMTDSHVTNTSVNVIVPAETVPAYSYVINVSNLVTDLFPAELPNEQQTDELPADDTFSFEWQTLGEETENNETDSEETDAEEETVQQEEDYTVLDVVKVQKYLHGQYQMTSDYFEKADINGDSSVNIYDMLLLKKQILNA